MNQIGNDIQLGVTISDINELQLTNAAVSDTDGQHTISLDFIKDVPVYLQKKANETYKDKLLRNIKNTITWIRRGKNQTIKQNKRSYGRMYKTRKLKN